MEKLTNEERARFDKLAKDYEKKVATNWNQEIGRAHV